MSERMMLSAVITIFLLMVVTGCGTTRSGNEMRQEQQEAKSPSIEGVHYTTIVFDKGESDLEKMNRANLLDLVKKARKQKSSISEIRILAWADSEYPDKLNPDTTKSDVKLASERASNIKKFLNKNMEDAADIDSFNMAKRPDLLSKMLRNDEFQVKEAFESSGATASELPDGSVSYTKASKAIVIIDYEGP